MDPMQSMGLALIATLLVGLALGAWWVVREERRRCERLRSSLGAATRRAERRQA